MVALSVLMCFCLSASFYGFSQICVLAYVSADITGFLMYWFVKYLALVRHDGTTGNSGSATLQKLRKKKRKKTLFQTA